MSKNSCFLLIALSFTFLNLNAQKTCIIGNCVDGLGVMLNKDGDTTISFFKNGNISDQVIVANKNHQAYSLVSVGVNKWFLEKSGDSLRIGQGAIVNKKLQEDISKGYYFITKKGDIFFENNKQLLQFTSGKTIKAKIKTTDSQKNRLDFVSNGSDYIVFHYELGKAVNGFFFVNATKRVISFDVVESRLVFNNSADNVLFKQIESSIIGFSLNGFDEYYFNNFDKQRTIEGLEQYILRLKNTLLRPVDNCIKLVEHATVEFEKMIETNKAEVDNRKNNPITLSYEEWNELLRKKVIEICKSDFQEEYSTYLSDKELLDLPSKDDEILYNLSRDNNNIISLSIYASNGALKFLIPAFKMAFSRIVKANSYIVPSAVRKFYDLKTSQTFDFRMKL
ncbi:hypothetical protein [Sediminibacterium sp.]|uniref:hypothetical protein n=1 Tax=Sediminibacterium sp. TaxID=1917865 RepID=UPI003F70C6FB